MYFERCGSGEPLVLVHGIGHNRAAWSHTIPFLAPYFDVIAVDLPGHGRSGPFNLSRGDVTGVFVDEFHELFDSLGIDRPHVAGNSLGGRIVLEMAARGEVATATALSPAGFWGGRSEMALVKLGFNVASLAARAAGPVAPVFMRTPLGGAALKVLMECPDELSKADITTMVKDFRTASPALRQILAQVSNFEAPIPTDVPVTIAWGTNDHVLPFKHSQRAKRQIPHASHIALRGCGHVPMPDAPELLAHLIMATASKRPTRSLLSAVSA